MTDNKKQFNEQLINLYKHKHKKDLNLNMHCNL